MTRARKSKKTPRPRATRGAGSRASVLRISQVLARDIARAWKMTLRFESYYLQVRSVEKSKRPSYLRTFGARGKLEDTRRAVTEGRTTFAKGYLVRFGATDDDPGVLAPRFKHADVEAIGERVADAFRFKSVLVAVRVLMTTVFESRSDGRQTETGWISVTALTDDLGELRGTVKDFGKAHMRRESLRQASHVRGISVYVSSALNVPKEKPVKRAKGKAKRAKTKAKARKK